MLTEKDFHDRWLFVVITGLAIVVGAWLRLWQIDSQILIDDEWHAIHRLMHADYREIFLSFGHADYSIPLTLFFNWMAETIGLGERRLRALPVLFGMLTIVAIPLALRPWLRRNEQAVLALLIAIFPVLIHFSRFVRPYAIVIPIGFLAVVALWRWWHDGDKRWLVVYIPATVACAWLHPLTMLFSVGALSWFGMAALYSTGLRGVWQNLRSVMAVGFVTLSMCALLVLPPLLADPGAMTEKSGVDRLNPETLLRAWEFFAGSAKPWVVLLSTALMMIGGWALWFRDRLFLCYWLYLFTIAGLTIFLLDAAWSHHGMVWVRYTAIAIPFFIALMALGLVTMIGALAERLGKAWVSPSILAGTLVFCGVLYLNGPLPYIFDGINQFTSSTRYHFNYSFDPEDNAFSALMEQAVIHDFYEDIADAPGEWEVIESPWYFDSNYSPLTEYQRFHQRKVRIGMISGLCTDWTHGELRPQSDQHIVFRHFVFLSDLLENPGPVNRFVVFHRQSPFEEVRPLPDIEPCIDAFREHYGTPWHESEAAVVFRLEAH